MRHLRFAGLAIGIGLAVRFYIGILWESRFAFPPDFDRSAFLSAHRYDFDSVYAAAFYSHLTAGAIALPTAAAAWFHRNRPRHVAFGRTAMFAVVAMLPGGWIMAGRTVGGPAAAAGFLTLTTLTALTAAIGCWTIRRRHVAAHRRWMIRCAALLVSPLLLRAAAGLLIVTQWETRETYVANAWLSWAVPLGLAECSLRWQSSSAATLTPTSNRSIPTVP